ncbi:hypothetical protein GB883_08070 [Georgenia thermotolerans]|uniref:Aquaporin n=1 Tax=Georgenia thermotolerans TaxID=527326 RepID=A0A7J5UQZ1_9MICO|nr:hypothetical protein GB883_08070 [Georgenia thermotolerans]
MRHLSLSQAQQEQAREFTEPGHTLRRWFAEVLGTFFLVLVAAGGKVVGAASGGAVGRSAAITAPGLMVMVVILFMGATSGAHLNPAVTLGFALRRDFPWRRVPGYLAAQLVGAVAAAGVLRLTFGLAGDVGTTAVGAGFTVTQALVTETLLTFGLVSTVLGASSGAQNIGTFSAIAVGGYIVLAGLWASPVSDASMNPARSIGPALVAGRFTDLWLYVAGPLLGAVLAVGAAYLLRGPGGGPTASTAAQGRPR